MLISLHELILKYNIILTGIIHVGAHECEELKDYEKYINRNKILWIDAIPSKVYYCRQHYPDILIEQAVVSDKIEQVTFNISNNGQSSSILEFGLHTKYHPTVKYVDTFTTISTLLSSIISRYDIPFNFINIDIQGAELKALKGMESYLNQIEYAYIEVNSDYIYKDCALIDELDDYLKKFNLIRVETKWTDFKWGDAFYIRKK